MSDRAISPIEAESLASKWAASTWTNGVGQVGWSFTRQGLAEFVLAIQRKNPNQCVWTEDSDCEYMPDTWDSACGERWTFIEGGPLENSVRFCQGCGKPVKLANPANGESHE